MAGSGRQMHIAGIAAQQRHASGNRQQEGSRPRTRAREQPPAATRNARLALAAPFGPIPLTARHAHVIALLVRAHVARLDGCSALMRPAACRGDSAPAPTSPTSSLASPAPGQASICSRAALRDPTPWTAPAEGPLLCATQPCCCLGRPLALAQSHCCGLAPCRAVCARRLAPAAAARHHPLRSVPQPWRRR